MSVVITDGFDLRQQRPLDIRTVFDTVDQALESIPKVQRYDGLSVYIKSLRVDYRFTGGIRDEDFIKYIPDVPRKWVYVYTQDVPRKVWEIVHNLDTFPSITVVDTTGRVVFGGDPQYLDANTILLSFTTDFAGKAILNYVS